MSKKTTPEQLRYRWRNKQEVALVDVREEGPYSVEHPLFALTVPVSEIEDKLPALVPRRKAPIVVYDNGEGYAEIAAPRISALGYEDVSVLEGGLAGYAQVGEVYRDVNVPSKAFGELVEAIRGTPSLPAKEAKEVIEKEKDLVVLDARRFEEYNTMSIPRGQSCPGGELVYRIYEAAPSPDTKVIVHCAGRTRSILGTQSLLNSGIPNKVMALRNGTIGWTLDDLQLETHKVEKVPRPSKEASEKARLHAKSWAEHAGVPIIGADDLSQLASAAETELRSLYLLDVRDPSEYAQGHPPGFRSAPGGQLVQATDEWVGVRGGRIVLYDDDGVRARMTGSWLLQLGWEVYVLDENTQVPDLTAALPKEITWLPPTEGAITVQALAAMKDVTVVDLARSPIYRKGHIPNSWHASGPELERDLKSLKVQTPIVLTSPDGLVAAINLNVARRAVSQPVSYLSGGTSAWTEANMPTETEARWLSEPIDVYKRPYEGTGNSKENMQGYIDWEHGLVAQLANDGVSRFKVVRDTRAQAKP